MESVSAIKLSGSRVIAGTSFGSIFVSSDNGTNWINPTNLGKYYVAQIAVAAGAGQGGDTLLFAATYADTGTGVFMSSDNGATWIPGGLNASVECLAANGPSLFAGTLSNGVYYSSNSGQSWSAVDKGLPSFNGLGTVSVTALAINPSTGGGETVYAATYGGGVFETTDNGTKWDSLGLASAYITGLATVTSGSGGTSVLATTDDGLYSRAGDATSWTRVDSAVLHFWLTSIAVSSSAVVVGSDSSLYISTDNGISWSQANIGVSSPDILATTAEGSSVLVGTSDGDVFQSKDNGTNWVVLNTDISTYTVSSFLNENGDLYAATSNGVYVSGSDAGSWIPASIGLPRGNVTSLASSGTTLFAGTNSGVFVSSDNGTNWSVADSGLGKRNVTAMLSVPSGDSTAGVYVGTPNGVFTSTDLGATWARSDSDLTDTTIASIAAVQLPGTSYPYVYIGTKTGTYYTASAYGIWNAQSIGLSSSQVAALLESQGTIFAGTSTAGIYLATSYGGTWVASDSGIGSLPVDCFAATPPLGQSGVVGVFAGTSYGVFLSTDDGISWSDVGMDNYSINSLIVKDSFLLAGTVGYGVWREPLAAMLTGVPPARSGIPMAFVLYQNYPNPFNPTTSISYQLPVAGRVTLKVYDILGREVATLVDRRQNPGSYTVQFNGSRFASGVYFYRLDTGNMIQVKKMVLVK